MTYKEIRNDDLPPQRVSDNTATPQRVTRMHPLSHLSPHKKEPEREPVGENEMVVTSPPLPRMDPNPKPNNISNNDGNTPEKTPEPNGGHLTRRS